MAIKTGRIRKTIERFITQSGELISEYDNLVDIEPFDFCKADVIDMIARAQKESKGINIRTILTDTLERCIDSEIGVLEVLPEVLAEYTFSGESTNNIQRYFQDVGAVYRKHVGDKDLEFKPENRDKLIELNTKMVISVAKRYQGLGLPLEDLISAGNLGLCAAWDKYDPSKSQLKDNILAAIGDLPEVFDAQDLRGRIEEYISYGKVGEKFARRFPEGSTGHHKTDLIKWIHKNVHNAKFSSVCMMWIRAYILIELDNHSRLIKKPKSEIYKDKKRTGSYQKENMLSIDEVIDYDTSTTFADTLPQEDPDESEAQILEYCDEYKEGLNKLLTGVDARDRSVLLKKYGIGLPRPLTPQEIADQEDLSVARVSQICLAVLNVMRSNATKYGIDPAVLFEAASRFK